MLLVPGLGLQLIGGVGDRHRKLACRHPAEPRTEARSDGAADDSGTVLLLAPDGHVELPVAYRQADARSHRLSFRFDLIGTQGEPWQEICLRAGARACAGLCPRRHRIIRKSHQTIDSYTLPPTRTLSGATPVTRALSVTGSFTVTRAIAGSLATSTTRAIPRTIAAAGTVTGPLPIARAITTARTVTGPLTIPGTITTTGAITRSLATPGSVAASVTRTVAITSAISRALPVSWSITVASAVAGSLTVTAIRRLHGALGQNQPVRRRLQKGGLRIIKQIVGDLVVLEKQPVTAGTRVIDTDVTRVESEIIGPDIEALAIVAPSHDICVGDDVWALVRPARIAPEEERVVELVSEAQVECGAFERPAPLLVGAGCRRQADGNGKARDTGQQASVFHRSSLAFPIPVTASVRHRKDGSIRAPGSGNWRNSLRANLLPPRFHRGKSHKPGARGWHPQTPGDRRCRASAWA